MYVFSSSNVFLSHSPSTSLFVSLSLSLSLCVCVSLSPIAEELSKELEAVDVTEELTLVDKAHLAVSQYYFVI